MALSTKPSDGTVDAKRRRARSRDVERSARQQERLVDIGAIAVSLAHDLRSPLGNISLEAYMLLEHARQSGTVDALDIVRAAQRIGAEAQRLEGLIAGFVDVAPKQRLDRTRLNLPELLQSVLPSWSAAAAERHVSLHLACPDGVPVLSADEQKLRRALDNLLCNALEAIDQGPGRIDIEVSVPEPEHLRISVRDTGPGIPATVRVFRIFETTKPHGLGLGLVVARQIVIAHGGTIWYENLQPHGAVFHVQLRCER